jgi:hypothetical protein
VADHYSVRWRQEASCEIDVVDFEAAIAEAASARTENDRAREIQSLAAATQLYEDDLLPGLYDDWLTPFREDYRQRVCEALRRLATLFEEQREFAAALPFAERLVALDPIGEAHHRLLMRPHAANHDRSSALRAYHQCMRVLRREMGVEPGSATVELSAALRLLKLSHRVSPFLLAVLVSVFNRLFRRTHLMERKSHMEHSRAPFIAALCAIVLSALNTTALPAGGTEIPAELVGAWTHIEWQANYGHYDPDKVDQFDHQTKTRWAGPTHTGSSPTVATSTPTLRHWIFQAAM